MHCCVMRWCTGRVARVSDASLSMSMEHVAQSGWPRLPLHPRVVPLTRTRSGPLVPVPYWPRTRVYPTNRESEGADGYGEPADGYGEIPVPVGCPVVIPSLFSLVFVTEVLLH